MFAITESGKIALLAVAQQIIDDPNYSGEHWYNGNCGCAMVRTLQHLGYKEHEVSGQSIEFNDKEEPDVGFGGGTFGPRYYASVLARETGIPDEYWRENFQDWSLYATKEQTSEVLRLLAEGQEIDLEEQFPAPPTDELEEDDGDLEVEEVDDSQLDNEPWDEIADEEQ